MNCLIWGLIFINDPEQQWVSFTMRKQKNGGIGEW